MAIAGKVAITPGYEWSVDVTYDKLVVVTYGNNVYLSTKPSTGIEPTNEEYWMLLIENVTAEDLAELQTTVDNIINGTTPVAKATDADTVDGWHIINNPNELGFTGQITMAQLCATLSDKQRFVWVNQSTAANGVTDVPYTYGLLVAEKRGTWCYATWIEINAKGKTPLYAGSWHSENGWTGWNSPTDFCLPRTGGKLSNNITIERTNHSGVILKNTAFKRDGTKPSEVLYTNVHSYDADGNNIGSFQNFVSTAGNVYSVMNAYQNSVEKSYCQLGVKANLDGTMQPYYSENGGTQRELFHTGNKPTGTYTGNGSATQRTIQTGGIGNEIIIYGASVTTIITAKGGFSIDSSGTVTRLSEAEAKFLSGALTISSAKTAVNANTGQYTYRVL